MNSAELLELVLEGGILNTHFFNGRFLTAEDLETEQQANRLQHRQLGQAAGKGVVYGMEVRLSSGGDEGEAPTVSVTRGLALNRKGYALSLADDVEVALVARNSRRPQMPGCLPRAFRQNRTRPAPAQASISSWPLRRPAFGSGRQRAGRAQPAGSPAAAAATRWRG